MKILKFAAVSLLAFVSLSSNCWSQIITSFGANAENGGTWTYTPETSTITGVEGPGDLLFGTTSFSIYSGTQVQITANVVTAPTAGFQFLLQDAEDDEIFANFSWVSFVGGATVASSLSVNPLFDYSTVHGWNLISGSSGMSINASLTSASVVPEPTTWALLAGSLTITTLLRRRRRV